MSAVRGPDSKVAPDDKSSDSVDRILHVKEGVDNQELDGVIGLYELRNQRQRYYGFRFQPANEDALFGFSSAHLRKIYSTLPQNIRKLIVALAFHKIEMLSNSDKQASTALAVLVWREGQKVITDVGNIGDSEAYLVERDKQGNKTAKRLNEIIHELADDKRLHFWDSDKRDWQPGINLYRVLGGKKYRPSHDTDFYSTSIPADDDYSIVVACDALTESCKEEDKPTKEKFVAGIFERKATKSDTAKSLVLKSREAAVPLMEGCVDDNSVGVIGNIPDDKKLYVVVVGDGNGNANGPASNQSAQNDVSKALAQNFYPIFKRITEIFFGISQKLALELLSDEDIQEIDRLFSYLLKGTAITEPQEQVRNLYNHQNKNAHTVNLLTELTKCIDQFENRQEVQVYRERKNTEREAKLRTEAETKRVEEMRQAQLRQAALEKEAWGLLQAELQKNWKALEKNKVKLAPTAQEVHRKAVKTKYNDPRLFKSIQYDAVKIIEPENLKSLTQDDLRKKLEFAVGRAKLEYENATVSWWRKKDTRKAHHLASYIQVANKPLNSLIDEINNYFKRHKRLWENADSFSVFLKKELDKISLLPLSEWLNHIAAADEKQERKPG